MPENDDLYKNNIRALLRIMASLAHASDTLIGKASNALMYQTGKDLGKLEGKKLDKTDDIVRALEMLMRAEEGVWHIEPWKNTESESFIYDEDGIRKARLIFRECPIRQVCMTHGIEQDKVICRITHGLFAGMMSEILGKKVDVHVEHAGPNACKKVMEMR